MKVIVIRIRQNGNRWMMTCTMCHKAYEDEHMNQSIQRARQHGRKCDIRSKMCCNCAQCRRCRERNARAIIKQSEISDGYIAVYK